MLRLVRGTVLRKTPQALWLQVGPLALEVQVPTPLLALEEGQEVALFTRLEVREEGLFLYGFQEEEALRLFELLLSVNGVGPRLALALLGHLSPSLLAQALKEGDTRLLASVPGVGKKLAERMVLELRSKVPGAPSGRALGEAAEEAVLALLALGFKEGPVRALVLELASAHPEAKSQDLIKEALKRLK
ncbi:Holliday junction branch migration protein RuvA [Thermus filiformis]|uniref:Holliday junction branch migration complex subunit RuvA n=1 Tax=Thermus filiformis TaxID=276 RepID=A0A0A2WTL2_THEFI|nr:Holliday junction branch migration protein RuvA [Thermus filiformis]KGQ21630.1 ATP-dependent DNA helicase RuvA [Thermus filiformis]